MNAYIKKSTLLLLSILIFFLWISDYLFPLKQKINSEIIAEHSQPILLQDQTSEAAPPTPHPHQQVELAKGPAEPPQLIPPPSSIDEVWTDPIEETMELHDIDVHLDEQPSNGDLLVQDDAISRFNLEKKDSYWASDAENEYIDLFSSQESLSEYTLINTECKSTSCKLSFAVTDSEQLNRLTSDLVHTLVKEQNQIDITFGRQGEGEEDIAVLYLTPPQKSQEDI